MRLEFNSPEELHDFIKKVLIQTERKPEPVYGPIRIDWESYARRMAQHINECCRYSATNDRPTICIVDPVGFTEAWDRLLEVVHQLPNPK